MKVKSAKAIIKAAGEQDGTEDGVFEAIVATWDLDSYYDKIEKGAFAETLAEWAASGDPIPVLWSHMSQDPEYHIGEVLEAEERDEGLWVRAKIDLDDDSPKAKKVYKLLKGRRVTQFSFAFDILDGGWVEQIEDGEDHSYYALRRLKLYEVGPCLVGVNQQTELLDVKSGSGRDVRVAIHATSREDTDAIRAAFEKAMGHKDSEPSGSGKNPALAPAAPVAGADPGQKDALLGVLQTINASLDELRFTLAGNENSTSSSTSDDGKATPAPPAAPAPPDGAKGDEPARMDPASLRVRTDLDAALAGVSLTD